MRSKFNAALALAGMVGLGVIAVHWGSAEAQSMPVPAIFMVDGGNGVMIAPPRQFPAVCIPWRGPSYGRQNLLIQNYDSYGGATNTTSIRVGPANVVAFPTASANGIVVKAGESLSWSTGADVCVVSESSTDAGVVYGVIQGGGAVR